MKEQPHTSCTVAPSEEPDASVEVIAPTCAQPLTIPNVPLISATMRVVTPLVKQSASGTPRRWPWPSGPDGGVCELRAGYVRTLELTPVGLSAFQRSRCKHVLSEPDELCLSGNSQQGRVIEAATGLRRGGDDGSVRSRRGVGPPLRTVAAAESRLNGGQLVVQGAWTEARAREQASAGSAAAGG